MGGDEFVLVLPASDCESIQRRIGELREIGARAGCAVAGVAGMTISIGEAFFPVDGSDAEQLLAEADRRMYLNKRAARMKSAPAQLTAETPFQMSVQ
jgi:diguanylate cyclase (GGDEF)-like protein